LRLWRISWYSSLEGLGGEFTDGRWHTAAVGKRIVYMAEHPALAILEALVNLAGRTQDLPDPYQLLEIEVASSVWSKRKFLADQKAGIFDKDLTLDESQVTGDGWLEKNPSALAVVPSAPAPFSWNILLNPLHSEAHLVRIANSYSLAYDERLFKISPTNVPYMPLQIERKKQ
jgi:RES domain-containing protein